MSFDGDAMSSLPLNINMGGRGGGNYGFLKNIAGGLNFNRQINSKLELNGSYFLAHANNIIDKNQYNQNFLPNIIYTTDQTDYQKANNLSHRLNFMLDYKIDSLNSIKLTTSGGYTDNRASVNTFVRSLLNGTILQNENKRDNKNNTQGLNYNLNLLYRHKFRKKGRTISTNLTTTANNQDQQGTLVNNNQFFNPVNILTFNQQNEQNTYAESYGLKTSYTEPLGNKRYLEFNHQYQRNVNDVTRNVFDMVNEQRIANDSLSNGYENVFQYNRVGTNFKLNRKKYNLTVGVSGQFSDLKGVFSTQSTVNRKFDNILPNASFSYAFAQSKNLTLDYNTSVREPSIQQLQPVINNTDPLNIALGNPNLRPQYTHRGSLNYVNFNIATFTNFFASANVNYTQNSIVNMQNISERLIRTTQPVNTKGTLNLSAFLNYGMRINKLNSKFNVGTNTSYNKSINLLNGQESYIHQQNIGVNARYEFNLGEIWDISLTANLTRQQTNYDFNATQNQAYLNEVYGVQTNLSFASWAWANANLNYMIYRSLTNDFYQELPMLNFSLSALVLNGGKGELKLAVVNALNQNVGVSQTATANALQQETTNSLGRYFMLSFTYSLSKISKPTTNRGGNRFMMVR